MSIDEIRSLVAERQRYDDWLTALQAKRAETPVRVFERVHEDYVTRRAVVMLQLREHVGALSTLGDELDGKRTTLETELASLEDERVEAMLRTAVGEYDQDHWEVVRQDVEAKIDTLGEQRGALLTEIAEIRALLSSAQSEPTPASNAGDTLHPTDSEPIDEPLGELAVEPSAVTEPVIDAIGAAPDATSSFTSLDGFGDDRALFVTSDLAAVEAPPEAAVSTMADFVPREDEEENALSMFADTTGTPDPTFTRSLEGIEVERDDHGASSLAVPSAPQVSTATVTPAHFAGAPVEAAEADNAFDDLAFLRSVTDPTPASASAISAPSAAASSNEPLKTLRCTECGTMNLPTEWYCERCGGELAAF